MSRRVSTVQKPSGPVGDRHTFCTGDPGRKGLQRAIGRAFQRRGQGRGEDRDDLLSEAPNFLGVSRSAWRRLGSGDRPSRIPRCRRVPLEPPLESRWPPAGPHGPRDHTAGGERLSPSNGGCAWSRSRWTATGLIGSDDVFAKSGRGDDERTANDSWRCRWRVGRVSIRTVDPTRPPASSAVQRGRCLR